MNNQPLSPDEKIAGVPLARLLRNLEETSYNEGVMDLACRLTDCKAVIEELLARRSTNASPQGDELRAEVREWLCTQCNTVYPGPPQKGFSCVTCPKCGGATGPRASMELRQARAEIAELQTALTRAHTQQNDGLPPLPKFPEADWTLPQGVEVAQFWSARTIDKLLREYGAACRASTGAGGDHE